MGNQQTAESKTVVILGAGYLGYTIAQLLNKEPQFRITLVDKKNFFEDNLAAVRYLVNPDFLPLSLKNMIPSLKYLTLNSFMLKLKNSTKNKL